MDHVFIYLVNRCVSNPCQRGGNCTFTGNNTYHCRCPEGFYGFDCEKGKRKIFCAFKRSRTVPLNPEVFSAVYKTSGKEDLSEGCSNLKRKYPCIRRTSHRP